MRRIRGEHVTFPPFPESHPQGTYLPEAGTAPPQPLPLTTRPKFKDSEFPVPQTNPCSKKLLAGLWLLGP